MKLIEPSFEVVAAFPYHDMLEIIEGAARTCYKSEGKICEGSAEKLIRSCIKRGHESVLEHCGIAVRIVCDRGVSHELVRHRLASYSQESTRYVKYGDVEFIKPHWHTIEMKREMELWAESMKQAETKYRQLIECGMSPQDARAVLPNSLKTEIVTTANIREWRHVFKLRCAKAAHPEMRRIMRAILKQFTRKWPVFFENLLQDEK